VFAGQINSGQDMIRGGAPTELNRFCHGANPLSWRC
jgi:hypothetical protein